MMEPNQDRGIYGAKRQSWEEFSPRELLARIMLEFGNDEKLVFDEFEKKIMEEQGYWKPILEYWFANNYRSLANPRPASKPSKETCKELKAKAKAAVEKIKEKVIEAAPRIVLMNLSLPNGKLLRDATFAECAKAGGWFTKLAKKGKPNQVVGKVMTEKQLHTIK